jgi:hypothetical protein
MTYMRAMYAWPTVTGQQGSPTTTQIVKKHLCTDLLLRLGEPLLEKSAVRRQPLPVRHPILLRSSPLRKEDSISSTLMLLALQKPDSKDQ